MSDGKPTQDTGRTGDAAPAETAKPVLPRGKASEVGGPKGLEPTRYGDWERDGRCVDF